MKCFGAFVRVIDGEIVYLSGENQSRIEFIERDQLRRCGVEARRDAGQRVAAVHRISQRLLRR